jgi:D-lactate dehydrogenase
MEVGPGGSRLAGNVASRRGNPMRVIVYSTKSYDRRFLEAANDGSHELVFLDTRLSAETASTAQGADVACAFVNDDLSRPVLEGLGHRGIRLIALRCAGFNNVDLPAASELGITVCRVPEYSPHAVAEHTVALIMALNRKTHRAYARVREGNFALEGLLGFDLREKTVGVIGTGKIGAAFLRIMAGFGCSLLAYDPYPNADCVAFGTQYVELPRLLGASHIVSLHCPLTPRTHHLIGQDAVRQLRHGALLINTSRGAVVDTRALIAGLKTGAIGGLGLDVYEEEADLFFENLSDQILQDDVFARLLTFPNVVITAHQAFFTVEAMSAIARVTVANITAFASTGRALHEVSTEHLAKTLPD